MILRGLLKLIAVVVAAGVVGAGLGIGLSKLSGDDGSPALAPQTASSTPSTATQRTQTADTPPATRTQTTERTGTQTTTATTRTQTTSTTQTTGPRRTLVPRVQILSAVLYPAATESGRARQRARVSIRVRVTNRGADSLEPEAPVLIAGDDRVTADPRATELAGDLLEPLAPETSATGELRFEIAGAVTQRLTAQPRARLGIANRTVAVTIQISQTPAPPN